MGSEEISLHATPPRTVKVHARGEDFRIVQLVGNLLVCSKEYGNCCCGWTEKGRAPTAGRGAAGRARFKLQWP